jgi:hypothetical protein
MKKILLAVFLSSFALPQSSFAFITPNSTQTPGLLCTPQDPNFKMYDYPEHIARCTRNVGTDEKLKIAATYGNIAQSEWPNYEFDHLIPLCAGGSDDITNLWPQPIAEAHKKDVLENDICLAMKAGTLTQAQAIQKVHDWFNLLALTQNSTQSYMTDITCKTSDAKTTVKFSIMGLKQISNLTVSLNSSGEEHEVISVKKLVEGKVVARARNPLLKDFIKYNLNEKSEDHFQLFLPATYKDETKNFIGFLKIGFEDNYPNLTKLICE